MPKLEAPLHSIDLAGGAFAWREFGDPGGTPLLFWHGWPGSSAQGIFLHDLGVRHHLRILAPDRPGVGASASRRGRSFVDVARLAEAFLDEQGIGPCEVVGLSGGGPYALATAWALPTRVTQTVVICGAPPTDSPSERRHFNPGYRAMLAIERLLPGALRAALIPGAWIGQVRVPWPALRLALRFLGPRDRLALDDCERFEFFYPAFHNAMRSGGQGLYEDGQCYGRPWSFPVEEILSPVRVWHGSQDTNFSHILARDLAARLPNAACFLRDEGHYSLPVFCGEEIVTDLIASRAGTQIRALIRIAPRAES
jgi:pimeloyl-ACP methyl ester carboxylesterase